MKNNFSHFANNLHLGHGQSTQQIYIITEFISFMFKCNDEFCIVRCASNIGMVGGRQTVFLTQSCLRVSCENTSMVYTICFCCDEKSEILTLNNNTRWYLLGTSSNQTIHKISRKLFFLKSLIAVKVNIFRIHSICKTLTGIHIYSNNKLKIILKNDYK